MTESSTYGREWVFARFLEESPIAIVVLDRDGVVIDQNAAAREGHPDSLGEMLARTPRNGHSPAWLEELHSNGESFADLVCPGPDGEPRHYALEARSIEGGFFVVALRDAMAATSLDDEIKQLRRIQTTGVVTASLLHDLNNLLTPMLGLTALLERRAHAGDDTEPLATELREVAERASLLVRDLLALGRRRPSSVGRIDLCRAIVDLRPLFARILGENVKLVLSLRESKNEIWVDRERLEHALLNLLANARDAMPRGGTLTISTDEVTLESSAAYVRLIVSDTGVGMTDDVRAHAFDPYFTTKPGRGNGLGLMSVRRFVEESGGLISLRSDPGHGTFFVICLPARGPARELTPRVS